MRKSWFHFCKCRLSCLLRRINSNNKLAKLIEKWFMDHKNENDVILLNYGTFPYL